MRSGNFSLPEGYRIVEHTWDSEHYYAAISPHHEPRKTLRLDKRETRTVGFLWWKRQDTYWHPIAYHSKRERLAQIAHTRDKR